MEKDQSAETIHAFNKDVVNRGGYQYTTNAPLSSRMANQRISDAVHSMVDFHGKRVIDIGCGDGVYTFEIYERGEPALIEGTDVAEEAISMAHQRVGKQNIIFKVASAYDLPYASGSFDVAHIRGVLHHMDEPFKAIQEALRVAPEVVVVEPNGFNLGLKIIEKASSYHREHHEKSYTSFLLNQWVKEANGRVTRGKWYGLVPMFCPDWFARVAKFLEPLVEFTPLLSTAGCAVYVFVAHRTN